MSGTACPLALPRRRPIRSFLPVGVSTQANCGDALSQFGEPRALHFDHSHELVCESQARLLSEVVGGDPY